MVFSYIDTFKLTVYMHACIHQGFVRQDVGQSTAPTRKKITLEFLCLRPIRMHAFINIP